MLQITSGPAWVRGGLVRRRTLMWQRNGEKKTHTTIDCSSFASSIGFGTGAAGVIQTCVRPERVSSSVRPRAIVMTTFRGHMPPPPLLVGAHARRAQRNSGSRADAADRAAGAAAYRWDGMIIGERSAGGTSCRTLGRMHEVGGVEGLASGEKEGVWGARARQRWVPHPSGRIDFWRWQERGRAGS
ncbi:hypothetical protein BD309DRAFT_654140 [Dichomitus squalens]|nr:hypothetical protein BD309DRAFT_654140 [Dichomitus squalens]